MYQIKTIVSGYTGKGWGLDFKDGVATTTDKRLAGKLKDKGYAVTTVPDKPNSKDAKSKVTKEDVNESAKAVKSDADK